MEIVRHLDSLPPPPAYPVATIGNFDGVHLGHQAILRRVRERARAHGGTAIVCTFDPHPLRVLAPHRPIHLLTPLQEKLRILEGLEIDLVVCIEFTPAFSRIAASRFVEEVLVRKLGVREVYVGHDYAFGKGREGNVETLRAQAAVWGFLVEEVPAVQVEGETVSSSLIRQRIRAGQVRKAATLLGRPYVIEGQVVHGAHRGKGLGFPTANLETTYEILPKDGVYAVWAMLEGQRIPGVANIGTDPTFGGGTMNYEVHLLDFQGEIYGKTLRMEFIERIREERKFPSPAALVEQIRQDVVRARTLLAEQAARTPTA